MARVSSLHCDTTFARHDIHTLGTVIPYMIQCAMGCLVAAIFKTCLYNGINVFEKCIRLIIVQYRCVSISMLHTTRTSILRLQWATRVGMSHATTVRRYSYTALPWPSISSLTQSHKPLSTIRLAVAELLPFQHFFNAPCIHGAMELHIVRSRSQLLVNSWSTKTWILVVGVLAFEYILSLALQFCSSYRCV